MLHRGDGFWVICDFCFWLFSDFKVPINIHVFLTSVFVFYNPFHHFRVRHRIHCHVVFFPLNRVATCHHFTVGHHLVVTHHVHVVTTSTVLHHALHLHTHINRKLQTLVHRFIER